MLKRTKGPIVQRLEEHGCTELAGKLTERRGIEPNVELRGSLNGLRIQNPYRRVVATLVRGDLQGKGFEVARRTVDIASRAAGVSIKPGERDKLAHMLDAGILGKKSHY